LSNQYIFVSFSLTNLTVFFFASIDETSCPLPTADRRPPSLTPLGQVEISKEITDETRQIALFFSPHPEGQITVNNLGLLSQIALNSTLLEPYRALPALVGKMYSKIHSSRARGWNEPQRHKGHKDRSII
jgi:hypothetical protein